MKREIILKLFPVSAEITQDTIDNAKINDIRDCIGARTLKSILPRELQEHVTWGVYYGFLFEGSDDPIKITTVESIDMEGVKEPQIVTFKIDNNG